MLKYAKKYVENERVKVDLIEDDISVLKNIKAKQDLIFCYETFFHIPPHLVPRALNRFYDLLSEEGFCLIQFVIKEKLTFKKILFDVFYWTGHKIKKFFGKGFRVNVTRYTIEEIASLIGNAGFKITKKYNNGMYLIEK